MMMIVIIIEQRVQKFNNGRARINYSLTIFSAKRAVGRVKMFCVVLRRWWRYFINYTREMHDKSFLARV